MAILAFFRAAGQPSGMVGDLGNPRPVETRRPHFSFLPERRPHFPANSRYLPPALWQEFACTRVAEHDATMMGGSVALPRNQLGT